MIGIPRNEYSTAASGSAGGIRPGLLLKRRNAQLLYREAVQRRNHM